VAADLATQVRQSFASSVEHLGVEVLDSYLLHGPRGRGGLSADDRKVWRAMEGLLYQGRVRLIGASNVSARQLEELCAMAEVRPAFVQNRCFARAGWDREVRRVCHDHGVVYQAFSLLTANQTELRRPEVARIATAHQRSIAQIVFRFALQQSMVCLTGTGDPAHMREDLAVYGFELEADEVEVVEGIAGTGRGLGRWG
jgi:diketogulonate reductase-like aldo/keto reductase